MTTTIFYFTESMLESLNTGTITEFYGNGSTLQTAVRGKIKSVQFGIVDFNISNFLPTVNNYPDIDPSVTFIELENGVKYYFNSSGAFVDVQSSSLGIKAASISLSVLPYMSDGSYNELTVFSGPSRITLEIDSIEQDAFFGIPLSSPDGLFEYSLTPVVWSGITGGGGGGQPSTPAMYNGKYVMTAESDPTQTELLVGGQALPTGSVVKVGSQKFFKVDGNSTAFVLIPQTAPAEWGWDMSGDNAWAVLQGF